MPPPGASRALRPATKKILGRTNENEPAWGSFFCKGSFCYMMLSKAGQTIVAKDGYVPVPAKVVQADLKKLGIM